MEISNHNDIKVLLADILSKFEKCESKYFPSWVKIELSDVLEYLIDLERHNAEPLTCLSLKAELDTLLTAAREATGEYEDPR